jgi:mono/diheme cytochrome c family protein
MPGHLTIERMKKLLRYIIVVLICSASAGCYYDNEEELYPAAQVACGTTPVSYTNDVAPIIQGNCLTCHSQAANMGSVVLEGYTNARTYAASGKLYGAVSHSAGYSPMPKNGNKLSDCNIAIIKRWIDDGAPNN